MICTTMSFGQDPERKDVATAFCVRVVMRARLVLQEHPRTGRRKERWREMVYGASYGLYSYAVP